jgi:glycolate oxidase
MVTIDGEVVRLGGKHFDSSGYDLMGVMVGSEGLLGVVTEVTVRILPKPPGARALLIGFASIEGAGDCVAAIIGAGIIPGGMGMMDRLAVEAAETFVHAGYPLEAEALLIVELDGCEAEINWSLPWTTSPPGAAPRRVGPARRGAAALWAGRGCLPGRRTPVTGLLLHGRHHSAQTSGRGAVAHATDAEGVHGLRVANVFPPATATFIP